MGRYKYGYDRVNKKKVYMGKYPEANPEGQGYYGRNEAGNKQEFVPKDAGNEVGFKGSDTEEYIFSNPAHGTRTITADSFDEALRQAKIFGFTRSDYKNKRRRRGR